MLDKLRKIKAKNKVRVGRGESSGKGKTAGRGEKGQKKHEKIKPGFEGGQLPIYQRLPQRRGIGNLRKTKTITVTTQRLNSISPSGVVDEKSLKEAGLVPKSLRNYKIKVVFDGKVEKKLKVNIPASKKAKKSIEKVGGKHY